jgi:hypothetical protein
MYDGGTPLNIAAQKGHEDVTEQLIEALCDVDLPYNDGYNRVLPNKSYPCSIVWADDTDSICDLPCLLTYLDNFASKRPKADATRSPTTGRSVRRASNRAAAPSSLPSSSSLPQPPLLPRDAPAAAPAPTAGVFAGIHSRPGSPRRQPHKQLTRSGSFAFLSDLFDTERLLELRDFLLARVMPKGEAVEEFAASMHLVLDLADKYPRDSLAVHILDCVAQFLPALLSPCTRSGRVRQIISNAKHCQRGEWKGLWETAFGTARN